MGCYAYIPSAEHLLGILVADQPDEEAIWVYDKWPYHLLAQKTVFLVAIVSAQELVL